MNNLLLVALVTLVFSDCALSTSFPGERWVACTLREDLLNDHTVILPAQVYTFTSEVTCAMWATLRAVIYMYCYDDTSGECRLYLAKSIGDTYAVKVVGSPDPKDPVCRIPDRFLGCTKYGDGNVVSQALDAAVVPLTICDNPFNDIGESTCIHFGSDPMSFCDAITYCIQQGGIILTPNSSATFNRIAEHLMTTYPDDNGLMYFISAFQSGGIWRWMYDGRLVDSCEWANGNPSTVATDMCATMEHKNGYKLGNIGCQSLGNALCQIL